MAEKAVAKLQEPFRSRIVGHGKERLDQLLANPDNPRIHPDFQQQVLAGGIDDVGFIRSLTVNIRSSEAWPVGQRGVHTLVDGHLRAIVLMRSEVKDVDVEYVDLGPEEEAEALATLDPISAMAVNDQMKLNELLNKVQSGNASVQQMLAEMAEKAGLYLDQFKNDIDMDEFDQPKPTNVLYRVVIADLTLEDAEDLARDLADRGAKVEQYRE